MWIYFATHANTHTLNNPVTNTNTCQYLILTPILIYHNKICLLNLILLSPTDFSTTASQPITTKKSLIKNKTDLGHSTNTLADNSRKICNQIKSTNLTSLTFGTIRTICELRLNNRIRKIGSEKEEK